ncbi:MAG: nitrous oxide-stimulated promoter family protein [Chloroflexota bacterium]
MKRIPATAAITRERRTIECMIEIFCHGKHGTGGEVCPDCVALHAYAIERLERCVFGADKPTCRRCPVHCYKPAMREAIRGVMAYAGPRMLWSHPILAIQHVIKDRKPAREKPVRGVSE